MSWKNKKYIAVVLVLLFVMSCGGPNSFVRDSYRTLTVSKQTYESTMKSLGEMYKEGLISEADKQNLIKYGDVYMKAHNDATDALVAYVASDKTTEASSKTAYLNAAQNVSKKLADLLSVARPFLIKEKTDGIN